MSTDVCRAAAGGGGLAMLKLSVQMGCHTKGDPLSLFKYAAEAGQAETLRYLSGCDIPEFIWDTQEALDLAFRYEGGSIGQRAAFFTQVLDICETARISHDMFRLVGLGPSYFHLARSSIARVDELPSLRIEDDVDGTEMIDLAVEWGSLEMLDWLLGKGYACDKHNLMVDALFFGHMSLLDTFIKRGMEWTAESDRMGFVKAAREGRLEDLRSCMGQPGGSFVFGNGLGNDIGAAAASTGMIDVLRLALEETTVVPDEDICQNAVMGGSLDALRFAVHRGAPLSSWCMKTVIEEGRIDMVQFLDDSGCPACEYHPAALACQHNQLDMLAFLVSSDMVDVGPGLLERILPYASCKILEWCVGICGETTDEALLVAAESFDYSALKLLYTRVSVAQWRRVYPGLLSRASCDTVKAWVTSTKTWV